MRQNDEEHPKKSKSRGISNSLLNYLRFTNIRDRKELEEFVDTARLSNPQIEELYQKVNNAYQRRALQFALSISLLVFIGTVSILRLTHHASINIAQLGLFGILIILGILGILYSSKFPEEKFKEYELFTRNIDINVRRDRSQYQDFDQRVFKAGYKRRPAPWPIDILNGAFRGDYCPNLGYAGYITQGVLSFIPVIGSISALRDLLAARSHRDRFGILLNGLSIIPFLGGFPKTASIIRNVQSLRQVNEKSIYRSRQRY